jgi:hypothetical protein
MKIYAQQKTKNTFLALLAKKVFFVLADRPSSKFHFFNRVKYLRYPLIFSFSPLY